MRVAQLCWVLISLVVPASAHIALWDEGMYGWDPNDPNQSEPVLPLMHLPFSQWWFHGYIDRPPQPGKFMTLPSGGTYHGQVACNKALTSYGQNAYQQTGLYACDGDGPSGGIGALHTSDRWESPGPKDVKGCGIAIAYESDISKIKPGDFAVISTNYTCPWFKHVDFQIPNDLPPCPEGGCHCMWGWIHSADSGSEQMYFTGYRCNVTGATGTRPIPSPKTANKCRYPQDKTNCTVGAKQPHYWYQAERNNNPQGTYDPPFYNGDYGFMNGAQTDLYANVGSDSAASSSAVLSSSISTLAVTIIASNSTSPAPSPSLTTSPASSPTSSSTLVSSSSAPDLANAAMSTASSSASSASPSFSLLSTSSTTDIAVTRATLHTGSSSLTPSSTVVAFTSTSIPAGTVTTRTTMTIMTTVSIATSCFSSSSAGPVSASLSSMSLDKAMVISSSSSSTPSSSSSSTISSASAVSSEPATTNTDTTSTFPTLISAGTNTCKRRKRSLESPEAIRRHLLRNEKRRDRVRRRRSQEGT